MRLRPALAALAALAVLAGACTDDDGPSPTSSSTTTTAPEGSTTTEAGSGRPLNDSELVEALLPPDEVAPGLAPAPDLGAGDLRPELCPGAEVEVTWDDQAAQALLRTGAPGTLVVTQTVLAFPDQAAATSFVDAVLDAVASCDPSIAPEPVAAGDRAVRAVGGAAAMGLVRRGRHVTRVEATGAAEADPASVVTAEVLVAAAARLPD